MSDYRTRVKLAEIKEQLRMTRVPTTHVDYIPMDQDEIEELQEQAEKLEQKLAEKWGEA